MKVDVNGKDRYVLYNDAKRRPWLSPKPKVDGFRDVSLEELDKLMPRENHHWRITGKGGLTWRTDEELAKIAAETEAKRRANAIRRKANQEAKQIAKGEAQAFAKLAQASREAIDIEKRVLSRIHQAKEIRLEKPEKAQETVPESKKEEQGK